MGLRFLAVFLATIAVMLVASSCAFEEEGWVVPSTSPEQLMESNQYVFVGRILGHGELVLHEFDWQGESFDLRAYRFEVTEAIKGTTVGDTISLLLAEEEILKRVFAETINSPDDRTPLIYGNRIASPDSVFVSFLIWSDYSRDHYGTRTDIEYWTREYEYLLGILGDAMNEAEAAKVRRWADSAITSRTVIYLTGTAAFPLRTLISGGSVYSLWDTLRDTSYTLTSQEYIERLRELR